jgi:hypothetical protein
MNQSISTMAQQIAQAASAFEERVTGHAPKSVTVVLCDNTLVITLHGALSPAEKALAQSPARPRPACAVLRFHGTGRGHAPLPGQARVSGCHPPESV